MEVRTYIHSSDKKESLCNIIIDIRFGEFEIRSLGGKMRLLRSRSKFSSNYQGQLDATTA